MPHEPREFVSVESRCRAINGYRDTEYIFSIIAFVPFGLDLSNIDIVELFTNDTVDDGLDVIGNHGDLLSLG